VTARARKDSRRAGVKDGHRQTPRLPLILNADTGEMVKRAREASERKAAA